MSGLKEVIVFLDKVGLYDVVLPFLLVFTIVFLLYLKRQKSLEFRKLKERR